MALSVASIKARIKTAMEAEFGTPDNAAEADKGYEAQAEWLFAVLTIDTTVNVASVSAVQPGAGVSGPGTGVLS